MIKIILNLALFLVISSCSILNFWADDEENLEEPRPLVDFQSLKEISILIMNWVITDQVLVVKSF